MDESEIDGTAFNLPTNGYIDRLFKMVGFEVYRDETMALYMYGRWRFMWHYGTPSECWNNEIICSESAYGFDIGPIGVQYLRTDD